MQNIVRSGFGRLRLSVIICIAFYSLSPPTALTQESASPTFKSKIMRAASSVVDVGSFTVSKIEPRPGENMVLIHFTDLCSIQELRGNLKLLPPAPIEWYNSTITNQNILYLRGSFRYGQEYRIILPQGFRSSSGRTYAKGVTAFTMPNRPAELAFLEQGSVIERDSRQMLHVQLMNVNEVMYKGLRLPPALVPSAIRAVQNNPNRPWNELKDEFIRSGARLSEGLSKDGDFRPLSGQVVEEGQLFFSQKEQNVFNQFSIPLSFRQEKEKGAIELVRITSNRKDQPAGTPLKIIRISDIGLSYKVSDASLLVWATSLNTGRPLPDAALYAFTHANEVAPLGRTDERGLLFVNNNVVTKRASLKTGSEGQIASKPLMLNDIAMVAAVLPADVSFTAVSPEGNLRSEGINQARVERTGETLGLKGHVFTERGIYRPGETVHFKGTVREYKEGGIAPPAAGETVAFSIVNSKGEEVYKKEIKLSEFGTASDSLQTKLFFPLGTYTLHMAYAEGEADKASRTFELQEFRQPRHYAEIIYKRDAKKDEGFINLDLKKELLNCEIYGKYYAGGPVKHGRVRWNIYHTKSDYTRNDFPGYSFGHPLEDKIELLESGESMLDENGRITVPVPLGKDALSGKYGIEVTASVVDFDGRAASDTSVYQGDPEYLIGISNHPGTVQPGEGQTLNALVIDKKGRKAGRGEVSVQVMQKGHTYIQKRNAEGRLYSETQQVWRKQLAVDLPIKNDMVTFDFDFSYGGRYLVTFAYKGADGRQYISGTEYSVAGYYHDYEYTQRDPKRAMERLSMTPEKTLYTSGETIKVYLNPHRPISTCLVTIEQRGLIEYGIFELKPGQRYIEFPVKSGFNPNVYISVLGTVARSSFPVYSSQFDTDAPGFLFGTVNVEVKGEQQKINISVNEEQKKIKSLPGAEMTLDIKTSDQAGKGIRSEVAIAVVDESILAMTGYETPSLELLGKFILPLGVFTGELRLDMLRQTPYGLFRNAPLTGGDGMEEAGPEAVTSKIRKDFNPVAYFNPSVRTDENGKAKVAFKFPDTMTTYRVYAVACDKGSRFGSYQRPALVVKDFYLEPGVPPFFTRGDKFNFSVSAFNKTEGGGSADFSIKTDDLISLATPAAAYPVSGLDRALIPVSGTAVKAGATTVRFSGKLKENSDTVELKLPVNSGHVLGNDLVFGQFRKQAQVKYNLPRAVKELKWEDTGPGEVKCVLTVSGSPFVRMTQGLQYFLKYPYG